MVDWRVRYAWKKHFEMEARANAPAEVAWRKRDNEIRAQVGAEQERDHFPRIPAAVEEGPEAVAALMKEIDAWRESRIKGLHEMYERWGVEAGEKN